MHKLIGMAGAAICLAALSSASLAAAPDPQKTYNLRAIPLEDKALRALDQKHLRLARKAGSICVHLNPSNVIHGSAPIALDGCTITQLDRHVELANNPALSAYHYAIRPGERYDQNRSGIYWRTVKKQLLANHPELRQSSVK